MRFRSPRYDPLHAANGVGRRIAERFRATAFWAAVLLPLGYAAVLIDGVDSLLVGALLVAHVACLVVGHGHGSDRLAGGER